MDAQVDREGAGCEFPDVRLKIRFRNLLGRLGEMRGATSGVPRLSVD